MRATSSSVALVALVALVGCARSASESEESSQQAVTGVTDITALEREFGLVKDTLDAEGRWSRPQAQLESGRCYKELIAHQPESKFEFRRYREGAAFFAVRGTGPSTSDTRPIVCVDVDSSTSLSREPLSVSGLALDVAVRYRLGRPVGYEGAAGHIYLDFAGGAVDVASADRYCGYFGPAGSRNPALEAGMRELDACVAQGINANACYPRIMKACTTAFAADIQADTLDRPSFDGSYVRGIYGREVSSLDPSLAALVYRYAAKSAAQTGIHTLGDDPVGRFVSAEAGHFRFTRLDAHHVSTADLEELFLTPKLSDGALEERAIVRCSRPIDAVGPLSSYACRGL